MRTYWGCRTANGWDANGFGQLKDGRGNVAPVTIILPEIAMLAIEYYQDKPCGDIKEDTIEMFMQLLEGKIEEARTQLVERFDLIASQSVEAARFMYENNTMAGYDPEKGIRSALMHGTLAVGQLGLAETLQLLVGSDHSDTQEALDLAKRIEQLFKDKCASFKKDTYTAYDLKGKPYQYHLNFGVYYSPAENLCFTAMKKFQERHGVIPKVSDKAFFTNSMHVPVWKHLNPIDKIKIEAQLTGYSSAGCITYVELDSDVTNNLKVIETLVNCAMDYDIPYFAINIPSDTCLECGYTDEFEEKCPVCDSSNLQHLRRVTGYLTGNYTTAFNPGKQEEVKMRYQHSKSWTKEDVVNYS